MAQHDSMTAANAIDLLKRASGHLENVAKGMDFAWDPTIQDPQRLHNMYVTNVFTSYISRYAEACNGLVEGFNQENYLVLALCGRALLELTAVLRYYVVRKYAPLLERVRKTGYLTPHDMKHLLEIDDEMLRGGNFDWTSFFLANYSQLREHAKARRGHTNAPSRGDPGAMHKQVRIGRCIDSWAKEDPYVGLTYDLFCDLVHPNVGSSFLVASSTPGKLHFSKFNGELVGRQVTETALPLLVSVIKPFGHFTGCLLGTMWMEDELSECTDAHSCPHSWLAWQPLPPANST